MGQCTAISKRSKQRCLNWAIRKRTTCRMHGGRSKGPVTRAGKEKSRQAVWKHGGCTKKAIAEHKKAMLLIKVSKDIVDQLFNFKEQSLESLGELYNAR